MISHSVQYQDIVHKLFTKCFTCTIPHLIIITTQCVRYGYSILQIGNVLICLKSHSSLLGFESKSVSLKIYVPNFQLYSFYYMIAIVNVFIKNNS